MINTDSHTKAHNFERKVGADFSSSHSIIKLQSGLLCREAKKSMLRLKCKSKYRTSFRYYLRGLHVRLSRSYSGFGKHKRWTYVPFTKKYRKRLYMLDTSFLPYKLRWIDVTSLPWPLWLVRDKARYKLRRVIESVFFQDLNSDLRLDRLLTRGFMSYYGTPEGGGLHAHQRLESRNYNYDLYFD